ncbi:MAG: carbohydrate ABC transporter permease [Acidimicrobiia bacterium]|jgi:multiple sugar transport system permease protein
MSGRSASRQRLHRRALGLVGVTIGYATAFFATLMFVYPLIWVAAASIKPNIEIYRQPLRLIPSVVMFDAYEAIFLRTPILTYMANSLLYAAGSTAVALAFALLAAYGISRHEFRGKETLMLLILSAQIIPGLVTIVPLYLLMQNLSLIDTKFGIILLYGALAIPLAVWILRGFFDTIPIELDESAWLDGATKLQTIVWVLLPVMLPALAAVSIMLFISGWNEFALASVLLRSTENLPLTVGTWVLLGPDERDFRMIAAATVINVIPILVVFAFLQRYLISGLIAGSVKG